MKIHRPPAYLVLPCVLAGSVFAAAPPAYLPLEIGDPEFDSVATTRGAGAGWVYTGPTPLNEVLLRPATASEWWDGRALRLLPGHSAMHEIAGEFDTGDRLFVGINALVEADDGPAGELRLELVDRNGVLEAGVRPVGADWRRGFTTLELPRDAVGPCQVRIRNDGSSAIIVDKCSVAKEIADPEGFAPLFNGKDLEGWTGNLDGYGVEDGAIRTFPNRAGGNLYTTDEFDDFAFRFAFKVPPGANNGIAIRAPLGGDAAYQGMEVQVLENSHPKYAGLKPWQFHGSVYGIAPALRGYQGPPGTWNHQEIRADGRRVTVVLNGKVIMDVDLDQALSRGSLSGRDHPGAARTSGHLGFCGHGDVVHFKDLRLRPNSGTPVAPAR